MIMQEAAAAYSECPLYSYRKKYSMWIYVLHMNVYNLIRRLHLETIMTNETVLFVCNSIAAYMLCILIAYVILAVWNQVKTYFKIV